MTYLQNSYIINGRLRKFGVFYMENEKKRNIVLILIFAVVIVAAGIVGFLVFNSLNNNVDSGKKPETTTPKATEQKDGYKYAKNPIDFKSLHKTNQEIFGWIKVPGTNVDHPLLQSQERDDFYLDKNIYKNYSFAGSIYAEYCNDTDMIDRVTVLYGHNMAGGGMFSTLHRFEDKNFFDKHKYFYIYTEDRKLTYQIVSAYNYDDRHIMNSFNFAEDEVFEDYLDYIQNPRSIVKNVRKNLDHQLNINDRIVTLSTCLNYGSGRYLVQGVLIKDELTE